MLSPLPLLSAPPVAPTDSPTPTATIWLHQQRFRVVAQAMAQGIFDALDEDLQPDVYLLALPVEAPHAPLLEPDYYLLPTERFADVLQQAGERPLSVTGQKYNSDMQFSESAIRMKQYGLAVRTAVQQVLHSLDEGGKQQSFTGFPIRVGNHYVMTVLRLQRKAVRAYPALTVERHYPSGQPLTSSLLMAAVRRFQEECMKSLTELEPGSGLIVRPRDTEELVRDAGKLFMDAPAQALGLNPATALLFSTCNTISSLRYEGAEGVGKLLLARRGHPNLEEVFALTCPTPLTDYRAVRKLLEMTTADVSLLTDGENVYALGRQHGAYDTSREDLFVVSFLTHYAWEFQHDGKVLMRTTYGLPTLPRARLNRTRFRADLRRTFDVTNPAKVERLWEVVVEASRQKHGTLLVITTEALAEADRLKLQCTLIEPVPLTPLITRLITAIDGAVLLDPESYCYSIGVILDGTATGRGNGTRGARYNSAMRYVQSSPYPCMAIVVSEDGLMDVLTKENLEEE